MRDVAKCDGHDCPRRDQCARFLAPILTEQNWVIVEDPANCDLFEPARGPANLIDTTQDGPHPATCAPRYAGPLNATRLGNLEDERPC